MTFDTTSKTLTIPRSDASVLHVDFENYQDNLINVLNAGIRWLGDPFSANVNQNTVSVIRNKTLAFAGERCGFVKTDNVSQRGRIVLQPRFDAPKIQDQVMEWTFRPSADVSVDLRNFVVWSTVGLYGAPVGLMLLATGSAEAETYYLDIIHGEDEERSEKVVEGLNQTDWIRIILRTHTMEGLVNVWIGKPGNEQWVGDFQDMNPDEAFHRIEFGDLSEGGDRFGSGYWDDVRIGSTLTEGASFASPEIVRCVGEKPPIVPSPYMVGAERQLFFDDVLIQSQSHLTRTFHAVAKHPQNPLLQPDQPWETECDCLLPMSVLHDADRGIFRCWYGIWGKQIKKPTYQALAESDDGLNWCKPDLGLFNHPLSSHNNVLREGRQFRVIDDPHDPDRERRYKSIIREAGFQASYSADGLRWRVTHPILDQAYDSTTVHWDPVEEKWIASCKIWWDGQRARGYAESADFINWTDTYPMLMADDRDGPRDQIYSLYIIRYESAYVGLLKIYHLDTDRCDIQVAFSRDAKYWYRPHRGPFIPNGSSGAWDYGNLDPTDQIHIVGDSLRFYYSGRSTLHDQLPNDGAMGLATLRRDGFVSLNAEDQTGVLVTNPVLLNGKQLHINANAARGRIAIEVLDGRIADSKTDESDVPIYPLTRANAIPMTDDSIDHIVTWQHVSGLRALRGQPVRLRFWLDDAQLYSFWVS